MEQKNTNRKYSVPESPLFNYTQPSSIAEDEKANSEKQISQIVQINKTKKIKTHRHRNSYDKKKKRIQMLQSKVRQLEKQILILKSKNFCDKCGSKSGINTTYNLIPNKQEDVPAQPGQFAKKQYSFSDLQFQRFQITSRNITPGDQDQIKLDGRTWIVTGLIMLLMGININGYDGNLDVYKITKQTVDHIRKQVEKSKENINFPVYYTKRYIDQEQLGITSQIQKQGFELQGLRLESMDEQEWMFEQQLNFNLKYEALIVMMEYMKEYASFT